MKKYWESSPEPLSTDFEDLRSGGKRIPVQTSNENIMCSLLKSLMIRELHYNIDGFTRKQDMKAEEFKSWKSIVETIRADLFKFRVKDIITVFPSSMTQYLTDKLKENSNKQDLMRHEWARLESFRSFPELSPARPIKLAQAGFYFTGTKDETQCFSCGIKHRGWKQGDSPLIIHRSKSANCDFINNRSKTNVPIHSDSQNGVRETTVHSSSFNGGASGGPSDLPIQSGQGNVQQTIVSKSNRNGITETKSALPAGNASKEKNKIAENYSRNPSEEQKTGVNTGERKDQTPKLPKHPGFVNPRARISSYSFWPLTAPPDPEELSAAGFYYAGFGDCVRCYQCGGGLRNWDYGDSPWVEHARWYPDCDHVRRVKGDAFIQQQQEELRLGYQQNTSTNTPVANMERSTSNNMESVGARSVLAMGYSEVKVRSAIESYQRRTGNSSFTAIDLMEIILESEENGNANIVATSTSQQGPTNNAAPKGGSTTTICNMTPKVQQTVSGPEPSVPGLNSAISNNHATTSTCTLVSGMSLADENKRMKEEMTCKICMQEDACVVFLPCGHMVACTKCAAALRKCAICRQNIKGSVRAYIM